MRPQSQSIKAKPNSNSVNNAISNVWHLRTMFWASPKSLSISPALASAAHTTSLLGSSWLHSTAAAVLGGRPVVLASPKYWGLLLHFHQ